jgi:hypothetical protein
MDFEQAFHAMLAWTEPKSTNPIETYVRSLIGSCGRDRAGDTPHTPAAKCLRLYDGAPPRAPDLIPA